MEMKKIYKSLLVLAAAMVLPLTLMAQPPYPKYKYDGTKHIGYNKYLLSDTPNADGEYTLRIENFIAGEVTLTAVPTDFVMVLDISGSMQNDYRTRDQEVPLYITKAQNELLQDNDMKKLRPDDGQGLGYSHYGYNGYFSGGNVGSTGTTTMGSYGSEVWAFETANPVTTPGVGYTNRWFYYEDDEIFYRIFRWHETISGANRCYVYFDRTNGERRYLVMNGNDITTTTTKPNNVPYANNRIVIVDNQNNSGYKLYRYGTRKDALQSGVNTFIDLIAAENAKDQWAEGVTKHQLAIVAFGNNNTPANLNQATDPGGNTHKDGKTKVARIFREINDTNKESYKNWDQYCNWNGYTHIYRGVDLGRRLLADLQTKPKMYPINTSNGALNRNKVMIVFTDGEPTALETSGDHQTPVAGYTGNIGQSALSMESGLIVKTQVKDEDGEIVNPNAINGVIYTINLSSNTTNVPDFLSRLSSNYPDGAMKVKTGTFATGTSYKTSTYFTGTLDPDGDYYKDANNLNNLESIFESIFNDNTGDMSSTMVAVDAVSDSFKIDFETSDEDKVKMYTAQCVGLTGDTITDDQNNPHAELAFAEEIEVTNRPALQHLWVERDGAWVDLGADNDFDIDNRVKFKVVGNSIIVYGFNYADLWCGLDETPEHNNTRQIEDTDPNFDKQLPGYRGFKVIFEFPIKLSPDALGGVNVPTNDYAHSGLFKGTSDGDPIGSDPEVNYPTPDLPVPVKLIIQKTGLKPSESANFTVQRRPRTDGSTYEDFMTFVLTGGETTPEIRIINLDPAYFYKVKEGNWSWAYEAVHPEFNTEPDADGNVIKNPIVFENTPETDTPKHAEAKATNKMRATGSSTAEFNN